MNEIDIIKLLIAILNAQLAPGASPLTVNMPAGIVVQQSPQHRQQGVPIGPAVFITHIPGTHLVGSPRRTNGTIDAQGNMVRTFAQLKESSFQINALVPQDPVDINQLTESDVLQIVAMLLVSDATQNTLAANHCGMLRIRDVADLWFVDDKRQWENNPHFDISIIHTLQWQEPLDPISKITATLTPN